MGSYKKGEEHVYGPAGDGSKCFYPNCHIRSKLYNRDACVTWDTNVPLEAIFKRFPPIVKLAIQENCDEYTEQYQQIIFSFYLHPECAAEWGMHLIKDALDSNRHVGRKLSNRGQKNA
jgi:hypothetical protein